MLNINSPTVQAMMGSVSPQAMGNMPVYFGNPPVIQETSQPQNGGYVSPYPSPKEMLIQSSMYQPQQTYYPQAQQPYYRNNIVGGYNPGFNAAFGGYYNPYMAGGIVNPYGAMPMDEESMTTQRIADLNGFSYKEQVENDARFYKAIAKTFCVYSGKSEEETERIQKQFEVFNKYERKKQEEEIFRPAIKMQHVIITYSDGSKFDADPKKMFKHFKPQYMNRTEIFDLMAQKAKVLRENIKNFMTNKYNTALERTMDHVSVVQFFNEHIGSLIHRDMVEMAKRNSRSMSALTYSREKFKAMLQNNGYKSRSQTSAIDRFTGRNGVMPNGRPVAPGHNPSIAESFSYDPNTGHMTITPPNFIANRMEEARQRFINSIK